MCEEMQIEQLEAEAKRTQMAMFALARRHAKAEGALMDKDGAS